MVRFKHKLSYIGLLPGQTGLAPMGLFGFRQPNVVKMERENDVEGLIDALTYNDNNVRRSAANALGKLGDPRAVEPLIAVLDDQPLVREVTAKALGKIGDPRAVDALVQVLKDDKKSIRETAAKALGEIGDKRAVGPLIDTLQHVGQPTDWFVATALGTLTGESFSTDYHQWNDWWENSQE